MIIKSLLSGNINAISIFFILVATLLIALIKGLKQAVGKDIKASIFYLIITALSFIFLALFSIEDIFASSFMPNYISLQVTAIIIGLFHIWLINKLFNLDEKETKWPIELFFSLIFILIGSIVFLQLSSRYGFKNAHYFFLTGTFTFILPWLFIQLFQVTMSIPIAIYKTWEYPVNKTFVQPQAHELKNPYLIKLEVAKGIDLSPVKFIVKAPEEMDFGKFFQFFINDYNQKHPHDPIKTIDPSTRKAYEWIFYKKPKFIGAWKQINGDKTVQRNEIKENNCIVCDRVVI